MMAMITTSTMRAAPIMRVRETWRVSLGLMPVSAAPRARSIASTSHVSQVIGHEHTPDRQGRVFNHEQGSAARGTDRLGLMSRVILFGDVRLNRQGSTSGRPDQSARAAN